MLEEGRRLALERSGVLKQRIEEYLNARPDIPTGFNLEKENSLHKEKILAHFTATEADWQNWRWQMKNRVSTLDILTKFINLTPKEIKEIEQVGSKFRWSVSPYYLSLIDPDDPNCPIRMQAIPSIKEMSDTFGEEDPMAEEFTSPAANITRRYPDRLIINVTNQCAMYCRHCQRRRNIGEIDKPASKDLLAEALEYINANPEIRDVLITGGDPLTLSDDSLDWLLTELDRIPHVEVKRLGSRTPVTMPQRITKELCDMLEKHHPLYLNTHFNHPKEVTNEAKIACQHLAKAGISLGNQAVLLRNINNNPHVMKKQSMFALTIYSRPNW